MAEAAIEAPPVAAAAATDPLRQEILSGRFTRPGSDAVAERLGAFLRQERGALAAWFGAETAAGLRGDPARLRGLIDRDIVALDRLIARQLDAVLHHPRLQQLEGSWRGLAWLVAGLDPAARLKARLLSIGWDEIDRDLARASEFDQSTLFRLIYENEFGTAGGEPFGLIVVDHELRHVPQKRGLSAFAPVDDISVLSGLAAIAAAAFVPMVLAASPALLGVDDFAALALSNDIAAA